MSCKNVRANEHIGQSIRRGDGLHYPILPAVRQQRMSRGVIPQSFYFKVLADFYEHGVHHNFKKRQKTTPPRSCVHNQQNEWKLHSFLWMLQEPYQKKRETPAEMVQ